MVVNYYEIRQRGMTLIELVVVLVIIAILAAVAMVQMKDVREQTGTTALEATTTNVRSAFAIAVTELKRAPTVAELATYVREKNLIARSDGIEVTINGKKYLVPTYVANDCGAGSETSDVSQVVRCIGNAVQSSSSGG